VDWLLLPAAVVRREDGERLAVGGRDDGDDLVEEKP
jgi:hypothetical protein